MEAGARWRCPACLLSWPTAEPQCKACETPQPGLSTQAVEHARAREEEKRQAAIAAFRQPQGAQPTGFTTTPAAGSSTGVTVTWGVATPSTGRPAAPKPIVFGFSSAPAGSVSAGATKPEPLVFGSGSAAGSSAEGAAKPETLVFGSGSAAGSSAEGAAAPAPVVFGSGPSVGSSAKGAAAPAPVVFGSGPSAGSSAKGAATPAPVVFASGPSAGSSAKGAAAPAPLVVGFSPAVPASASGAGTAKPAPLVFGSGGAAQPVASGTAKPAPLVFGSGGAAQPVAGGTTAPAPLVFGSGNAAPPVADGAGTPPPKPLIFGSGPASSSSATGTGGTTQTITFSFGTSVASSGTAGRDAPAPQPAPQSALGGESAAQQERPKRKRPDWARRDGRVPVGEVFVHGSGECDQLGLGDARRERRKPTLVPGPGASLASLACGAMHAACVESDGALWTWGCNDDGALGRPAGELECEPRRLELPGRAPVRVVACGDCHTCALDAGGGLWLWGTYKDSTGYIGIARPGGIVVEKSHVPAMVDMRNLGTVSKIASGDHHTVISTAGGGAYAWGSNATGQLGLESGKGCQVVEEKVRGEDAVLEARQGGGVMAKCSNWAEPRQVIRLRDDSDGGEEDARDLSLEELRGHVAKGNAVLVVELPDRVVSMEEKRQLLTPQAVSLGAAAGGSVAGVFASCHGTFVTLADGGVLGCGLNGDGQMGMGFLSSGVVAPRPILGVRGASWLGGGSQSSAALVDGRVRTWGKAEECGLGLGAVAKPVLRPREVSGLPAIRALRCGSHHTLACSEAGDVFTWGCGLTHQLGNRPRNFADPVDKDEEPTDESRPYLLSSKQLEGRFVLLADGGAQHSLELAWSGEHARLRTPRSRWQQLQLQSPGSEGRSPASRPPSLALVPLADAHMAPPVEAIVLYKRPAAAPASTWKRPAAAAKPPAVAKRRGRPPKQPAAPAKKGKLGASQQEGPLLKRPAALLRKPAAAKLGTPALKRPAAAVRKRPAAATA